MNLRDVVEVVPGAVAANRIRRRRQELARASRAVVVRVARELGVAVALLACEHVGLGAVLPRRLRAQSYAHHAGEVKRRDPPPAGVDASVHGGILARRRREIQLTELASEQQVGLVVAVARALAGDKVALAVTVAVVGAVGVLAGVTKVSRRAVALARAVVACASARALRLDLPEQAQQVPLAGVLRAELLGEIPRELRDPAAGDGIPVERVHRPRGHRVLAIHEDDVRDALRGCGDGEPVPGDGPRRRRVSVRGAETHLGHLPSHCLVERLEVRLAEGDVDVFANQVALRARPERAIRAKERIHAGALAGAAHAINLPGLVVRLADLFRVARAAAGAVVGATHVGAVVVGVTRVAPALGREHGRVAKAVALAVVPAPAGVHAELVLESLEDGRKSALVIPAGSRGVRGELRRD
mmetsp:Transcript_5464/g.22424  ORF Transcript_5464/g.22424 Transcript_5464/m.22424 type:complete len:414 (-) Transcript_5464:2995-4236(-)